MPSKKTKTKTSAPVAKTTTAASSAPVAKTTAVAKTTTTASSAPVANAAEESTDPTTQDLIDSYSSTISSKWKQINSLQASIRADERARDKLISRAMKAYTKMVKTKNAKKNSNRERKGIAEERMLSNELAAFIGQNEGTKMTSCAITSLICEYATANNLNDAKKGNRFYPDEKLSTLLGVKEGTLIVSVGSPGPDGLHLQTALKKHFKSTTTSTNASSAA
jgi:chromatin remodeling complex protein RSC6